MDPDFKFGVILPNYGAQASREALLNITQTAEALNFDSVWLTDHVAIPEEDSQEYGWIFESLTTMAYLAAKTERIRLGTSVLVLPQRNPVVVAKQVANLDVLSGGRVILAVGVGWSAGEYANLGEDFASRGARMDEAILVMRTLWNREAQHSFDGKHYRFERAVVLPGPVQAGGPPVWVGGASPPAIRRAATMGDGWHPNAGGPQAITQAMQTIRALRGEKPITIVPRIRCSFAEKDHQSPHLFGSPAEMAAKIQAYRAAGVNGFAINFLAPDDESRLDAIRRFAAEVMPVVQA